jgi:starch synthase
MKIYSIASEVDPFAKTGGLADVAAALPKALAALGHDVRLVLPLYRQVHRERFGLRASSASVSVTVGSQTRALRVWDGVLPKSRVPALFLECAPLFDREGLYQDKGRDHPDNLERFSVFSQAALRLLPALNWKPDVVHAHDWQAALALAHLAVGGLGREPFFASMGRAFTVHNLAYQGLFPREQWRLTGLPEAAFSIDGLEYYNQINCLKGGLVFSDALTTVSPTYAREIQTPEFGCGLDGVLRARGGDLAGILNGIDPEEWNPQADPHTAAPYSADERAGKSLCKQALQRSRRLPEQHDLLIGMIQRLVEQKGIDIFIGALEELMALPLQIVVLGTGDPTYHEQLTAAAARFPGRLAVTLAFDNALAHQIEAGADAFLMPSRFEPCGLNQMYSMRFGTVPIVTRVGGLADTVVDVSPATSAAKTATGFVFEGHSVRALVDAVRRTVSAFGDHGLWTSLVQAGMRRDFSWSRAGLAYVQLYERAHARAARRTSSAPARRHTRA